MFKTSISKKFYAYNYISPSWHIKSGKSYLKVGIYKTMQVPTLKYLSSMSYCTT